MRSGADTPSGAEDRTIQPSEGMEIQIPESKSISGKSISVYFAGSGSEPARLSSVTSGSYRVFLAGEAGLFSLAVCASTAGLSGGSESNPDPEPETIDVTIVEETETELEQEPDQTWEELEEEQGPVKELEDFDYGEEWVRHDVLDKVNIPSRRFVHVNPLVFN